MQHKNDYSCIAFFESGKPKKWQYVHKLDGFVRFLNQKHQGWKYLNVYERRTGKYLKRFYPGSIIPKLLLVLAFFLTHKFTFSRTFSTTPFRICETDSSKRTFNNGFNNSATNPTILFL